MPSCTMLIYIVSDVDPVSREIQNLTASVQESTKRLFYVTFVHIIFIFYCRNIFLVDEWHVLIIS